jgi:hypothetical protein
MFIVAIRSRLSVHSGVNAHARVTVTAGLKRVKHPAISGVRGAVALHSRCRND